MEIKVRNCSTLQNSGNYIVNYFIYAGERAIRELPTRIQTKHLTLQLQNILDNYHNFIRLTFVFITCFALWNSLYTGRFRAPLPPTYVVERVNYAAVRVCGAWPSMMVWLHFFDLCAQVWKIEKLILGLTMNSCPLVADGQPRLSRAGNKICAFSYWNLSLTMTTFSGRMHVRTRRFNNIAKHSFNVECAITWQVHWERKG